MDLQQDIYLVGGLTYFFHADLESIPYSLNIDGGTVSAFVGAMSISSYSFGSFSSISPKYTRVCPQIFSPASSGTQTLSIHFSRGFGLSCAAVGNTPTDVIDNISLSPAPVPLQAQLAGNVDYDSVVDEFGLWLAKLPRWQAAHIRLFPGPPARSSRIRFPDRQFLSIDSQLTILAGSMASPRGLCFSTLHRFGRAVLCFNAFGIPAIHLMTSSNPFSLLISHFTTQIPVFAVCLIGTILILVRWNQASRTSTWALAGFGLSALLCVIIPIVQVGVQQWFIQNGGNGIAPRAYIYTVLSFLWASLRAISYGLLLVGFLVGRTEGQANSGVPNPLPGNTR